MPLAAGDCERPVVVGKISGLYGVRGWVKIHSWTEPREQILSYTPWSLSAASGRRMEWQLEEGRRHGKGVVAKLAGVDDRDQAAGLVGCEITIPRSMLPPVGQDEHYWSDLIGLEVVNQQGVVLGRVDHLFETGANDVMVVRGERERLLPYIRQVILEVDLERSRIAVDWDADF